MISTHGYVSACPELGKPDTGGQVVYVLEVSKQLAKLGYYVDILTRQFGGLASVDHLGPKIRILRFPCGGNKFIPKEILCYHIPEWVARVEEYVKLRKYQYSFINSHYWDGGLAGQTLSNHLHIPHVHTPHSIGSWKRDSMHGDPEELEKEFNFAHRIREEKVVYDECDLLVATTVQQRNILLAGEYDVPANKILIVPPGYDDSRFFPLSLASRRVIKRELGLEGPIILALGRMASNKGYDLLLEAMPLVVERHPNVQLVLAVGSSEPSAEEQEQMDLLRMKAADLDLRDNVLFKDYIPDEELAKHYHAADVFALSSRYEPFGMTAVEAMACGIPTVITTKGGLWEQLEWGRECLPANPLDSTEFGLALSIVLTYPQLKDRLASHGPKKARACYTWAGIVEQILKGLWG